ncbi:MULTISPECIES: family 10 glycosylhydrolase [unclassified Carboxylicivirga]|uniref:glycoside hydrolase family 10 protein n=1 Tax=Carboxylicivirga TaxID=1628153 RepID=UPI003D34BDF7
MNKLLHILMVLLVSQLAKANAEAPKREMRSTWLTTVWGLDWPSTKVSSTGNQSEITAQKNELIALLDNMKEANINSIFFQVRSECDAMYKSSYEPWSAHLVTTRGLDPGYDPLAFAIEEAHKRGMELHAWINPYRFESSAGKYQGAAGDYRKTEPKWVLEYPDKEDGKKNVAILDPGNPEVRKRIVDIVKEVVNNYDVDGVAFDDYFYAYGGTPDNLDAYSQGLHKPEGLDLHDWRRANINEMVSDVYGAIQDVKPWVTFGLSPFGIYTTDNKVAAQYGFKLPDGIVGLDAYKDIYCDPLAWLKAGTVDYISPQIYWPTTSTGQDYDKLSPWWSDVCNAFYRHLYVSHSLSNLKTESFSTVLKSGSNRDIAVELNGMSMLEYLAMKSNPQLKNTASEYGMQIQVNRQADKMGAPGSVFYRTDNFSKAGFVDYLKANEFKYEALVPAINWKSAADRSLSSNLRIEEGKLMWESTETNVRYTVYALPKTELSTVTNLVCAQNLLGVSYQKSFDLSSYTELLETHVFAVAVLDRFGNEYPPVLLDGTIGSNQPSQLIEPVNKEEVQLAKLFRWQNSAEVISYVLEVAKDEAFTDILYKRELLETQFDISTIAPKVGEIYYWRIKSRVLGAGDELSEVRSFTMANASPTIISSPVNNATEVSLTPTINWNNATMGGIYTVQIAETSDFTSILFEKNGLMAASLVMPEKVLLPYSTYYLRVKGDFSDVMSGWSEVIAFSTIEGVPDVPRIISPMEKEVFEDNSVEVLIEGSNLASSYTLELSEELHFPEIGLKVLSLEAFTYKGVFEDLGSKTYYLRARANYGANLYTTWSEIRTFSIGATNIGDNIEDLLKLSCSTQLSNHLERVEVSVPGLTSVRLVVYGLNGVELMVLDNSQRAAGDYEYFIPASKLTRGIYILMLQTQLGIKTLKLVKY